MARRRADTAAILRKTVSRSASYPLLSEETRANPALFVPAEIKAKSEVIADLGADNAAYTCIWDEIKAAP